MKRINFPMDIDLQTNEKIRKAMREKTPEPKVVREARLEAYEKVREMARAREVCELAKRKRAEGEVMQKSSQKNQETIKRYQKAERKDQRAVGDYPKANLCDGKKAYSEKKRNTCAKHRWTGWKTIGSIVATAAVFSGICVANPAFAAKIPLVGHVFEQLGDSLGFAGDYEKYAVPLDGDEMIVVDDASGENGENGQEVTGVTVTPAETEETGENETDVVNVGHIAKDTAFSQTVDGVTVTLSELYCNETALYLSMLITSEDPFPDTLIAQWGAPVINLYDSSLKLSYNPYNQLNNEYLDGQMIDDHTYAGVLRVDLAETLRWMETDESVSEGEKPEFDEQITWQTVEFPKEFSADMHISKIVGYLPEDQVTTPEMPQDLIDEYEQAMAEAGLDTSDEAYASYTEEQQKLESSLRNQQWKEFSQRYPEVDEYPNQYENWWFEGDWDFHFDVTVDDSETITKTVDTTVSDRENTTKTVNTADTCEIGEIQITKTPFEIVLDYDYTKAFDYFVTVLDANGTPMEYGNNSGSSDTHPVAGYDVSKITIYVCDYYAYMDELKGYYYSPDYEEKAKEKTYQQLLDERCIWSEEVDF